MAETYLQTITMITENCCNCGVTFALTKEHYNELQKMGIAKTFYCPNGHPQHYTKSEATRVREQSNIEKAQLQAKLDQMARDLRTADFVKSNLEVELKRKNLKLKRVENGMCPCCNRFFKNLSNHMENKHSEKKVEAENPIHKKINKKLKSKNP